MSKAATKILLVNWKWEDELEYPTFIPHSTKDVKPLLNEFVKNIEPIKVVESTWIEDATDHLVLKEGAATNKYIIPTKANLMNILSEKDLPSIKVNYVHCVIDEIIKLFADSKKIQIVCLYHMGDGFDDINELLEIILDYAPSVKEDLEVEIKVGFFGKGHGIIYEFQGFLPIGSSFFRYKGKGARRIGGFRDQVHLQFLKEEHFDPVWNHYWYETRKRLEDLRKWMMLTQVPKSPDTARNIAKSYTEDLLINIGEIKDRRLPQPIEEGWDFSSCSDLAYWTKTNPDFKLQGEWIEELKKFHKDDLQDFTILNKAFDNLIASFQR